MSKDSEEPMEISSTTDLEPKSATEEPIESERMEVETIEGEESQTEEITSTNASPKRIEDKIEAASEATNDKENGEEKKSDENIDTASPGRDETDTTEKTIDEKSTKPEDMIGKEDKKVEESKEKKDEAPKENTEAKSADSDPEISSSDKSDVNSTKVTSSDKTSDEIAEDTSTSKETENVSDDPEKRNADKDISENNEKTDDISAETSVDREKTSDEIMEVDDNAIETNDKSENISENLEKNQETDKTSDKESMETEASPGENATSTDKDNSDSVINDENSIFVQVNPESSEKDDPDKPSTPPDQATSDVDPIAATEWSQNTESESTFVSELDEADECIVPDASTSRDEISSTTSKELSQTSTSSQSSDSSKLSDKYLVSVANSDDQMICMICDTKTVCKYDCSKDEAKTKICSEDCLSKLKAKNPENVIVRQLRVKSFSIEKGLQNSLMAEAGTSPRTISCVTCRSSISNAKRSLSWEALDFCNEQCLTRHQKLIGSFCANCKIDVKDNFLGKYCVRFGYTVRQFCSSTCLEEYKKGSKVCSFCQDDISGNTGEFSTSIGDKGLTKDFCSANCMQRYSMINKKAKGPKITGECCVCHKINIVDIEFEYKSKNNLFCSEPCFVAFKYVNDIKPEKCDMCCQYFLPISNNQPYLMRYDGVTRKFCLKTCQNIYITTHRKIVSCCWCKVKKYNFDMIQKYQPDSGALIVCSLTCLNFFNASLNAAKTKKKRCDSCNKICKGQYHITLADDSMKNFCSYPCVQEYQSKYLLAPARYSEQPVAISSQSSQPAAQSTPPTRVSTRKSVVQQRKQIIPDVPGPLPIITSVRSLAPTQTNTRQLRSKSSTPIINTITTIQEPPAPPPVRRIIVLRPPDLPSQRNMSTLAKPITCDVGVDFKPVMVDKAVQTEDIKDSLILVPVPVPIYVPAPMKMFELMRPIPLPFPFPIPIPMFIPVTKQTAGVVLKELKKTQIKTDPYEADLLMMAELVAGEVEKKDDPPESESDGEAAADNPPESYTLEPQEVSNSFGDEMLQMALKMASDFEEPAVDLEGALTASTITATAASNESEEVTPIQPPVERSTYRGRKRGRQPRHGGRGRRGRPPKQPQPIIQAEPEPQQPSEPVEKPDANMCLKYTFGVNAWKQWVTTKNAELERTSRAPKPFKTDLLQLTSDELNYSLCLFVKEVRKPNGAEYAPDTIYYLCLGIQQYLFENGRIDNIFCDSYYESFTECLDEVCKKFSTLYNDSQYIVTRVEEEHLWESKQLGAHSPHVLLSTLMFFNTKHFNLTNVEEHMQLSFSHIMKHWKRVPTQNTGNQKNPSSRNILLRFYPPQSAIEGNNRKKKVYEQQENEENPLRCPVKLYEFYLSKCPESVKTRNDVFYLLPERSCVPDSPVWYSTMALGKEPLEKMLHRVKMVKEINVALLAS